MNSCCFGFSRRKQSELDTDGNLSSTNIKRFSYNELSFATQNFHSSNRIGRGGFGSVYKGTFKNGNQVAVKSLAATSKQGTHEFLTEIDMITNVKHPNLVGLIGCCVEGNNRVLVYEYVENGSLDHALFGSGSKMIALDWAKRANICMGTARALAFLHEELDPHIVHRDIKASNILLDKNIQPKIGDFGLAKLFPDNVTHLSTRVAGTIGYLAPEYAMRGQLTKKADIYSFGVLVLEIVSGRSSGKSSWSGSRKFLLEWAWELYEERKLLELVDAELGEYPEEEVLRYLKVALFCTQGSAQRRPSMTQIIDMLSKGSRLNEELLTPPGIIQDLVRIGEGIKAKNPSNSPSFMCSWEQKSPALESTDPFSSGPSSFSEMIPR